MGKPVLGEAKIFAGGNPMVTGWVGRGGGECLPLILMAVDFLKSGLSELILEERVGFLPGAPGDSLSTACKDDVIVVK